MIIVIGTTGFKSSSQNKRCCQMIELKQENQECKKLAQSNALLVSTGGKSCHMIESPGENKSDVPKIEILGTTSFDPVFDGAF